VKNDLKNLELSMIDKLEVIFFGDGSGNLGKDFDGLGNLVAVNPLIGTIGGLDRSAQTWFRNFTRAYSTAGMDAADKGILFNFRKVYNSISVGNDHPTLIMAGQDVYELYEAQMTTILQLTKTKLADAGFDALSYKGSALTYSPSAPAAEARFLNERYIELIINSNADFLMTNWKDIPNQLDRVVQVVVEGNLTVNNARMHGVLHTIA